ncbi:hypothetical protein chiPu_0019191, partial [Chiloscyllium punctatum]|nr:hypothetical protein [Chiloscyllium punctatum]
VSTSTSDPLSADSPSCPLPRGPSSKLINKKCTRLVSQGVQTESLEGVPSTSGRRTRDVGVTYPSPDSNLSLKRPATVVSHRHHSVSPTARYSSSTRDRKKKSSHTERRPGKTGSLYEQLPEVTRRKEEEKRKREYQTNRLKAQLYKQKITNHVLGRKVSWQ